MIVLHGGGGDDDGDAEIFFPRVRMTHQIDYPSSRRRRRRQSPCPGIRIFFLVHVELDVATAAAVTSTRRYTVHYNYF